MNEQEATGILFVIGIGMSLCIGAALLFDVGSHAFLASTLGVFGALFSIVGFGALFNSNDKIKEKNKNENS